MLHPLNQKASFYGEGRSSVRLLVIDDDPVLQECATAYLGSSDVTVDQASNGRIGLEMLLRQDYDAVLVDLYMPQVDGLSLLMRMQNDERLKHIPTVMITARNDVFAIDRAYEIGATAFTVKPINWTLLCYQLRYLLRMARVEAELRSARDRNREVKDVQQSILRLMRHETLTPMNSILGFAKLLRDEISGPLGHPNYNQYVGLILEAADRLHHTLDDLQLLARLQDPSIDLNIDQYFLSSVLARALERIQPDVQGVAGAISIAASIANAPRLSCDFGLLARGFEAVIKNALTHGAGDRPCSISFEQSSPDAGRIVIRDHGKGIAEKDMAKVLQPFRQDANILDRPTEGLGIGLALAKQIFEIHGGSMQLAGAENQGLCVTISLPLDAVAELHGRESSVA